MLFGPSDPFAFPICLSARDSHRFDPCLNQLFISKCSLRNKHFIPLRRGLSVSKSATYTERHLSATPSSYCQGEVAKAQASQKYQPLTIFRFSRP
jgi:hypothetical protein